MRSLVLLCVQTLFFLVALPHSGSAGVLMMVSDENDSMLSVAELSREDAVIQLRGQIINLKSMFDSRDALIKLLGNPVPQPKPMSIVSIAERRVFSVSGSGRKGGPKFRWEYYVKKRACVRALIRDSDNKILKTVLCYKKDAGFQSASKKTLRQRIEWEKARLQELKKAISRKP